MARWTLLPPAERGQRLGPDGPEQCTLRAARIGSPIPERCGFVYGHHPYYTGTVPAWAGESVEGHEPWREDAPYYTDVGGHRWRCDRGPLSICTACGLTYSRWDGGHCPELGAGLSEGDIALADGYGHA